MGIDEMNDKSNIKSPEKFQDKLNEVIDGIYELFELAKEHQYTMAYLQRLSN